MSEIKELKKFIEGSLTRGGEFELPVIDPAFDNLDKKSKYIAPLLPVNDEIHEQGISGQVGTTRDDKEGPEDTLARKSKGKALRKVVVIRKGKRVVKWVTDWVGYRVQMKGNKPSLIKMSPKEIKKRKKGAKIAKKKREKKATQILKKRAKSLKKRAALALPGE